MLNDLLSSKNCMPKSVDGTIYSKAAIAQHYWNALSPKNIRLGKGIPEVI